MIFNNPMQTIFWDLRIRGLIQLGGMIMKEATTEDVAPAFVIDGIVQRHQ